MDMWKGYINAAPESVPNAEKKMEFDRFHVMQYVLKAVDKVRRKEHRKLLEEGEYVPKTMEIFS